MSSQLSSVLENAFEQILSSDLNRIQRISSRELQNILQQLSLDSAGIPISGLLTALPVFTGVPATFTGTVSPAAGFFQSAVGVTSTDDSLYQALRWHGPLGPTDPITAAFAAPDPGNPRIDLVTATPAQETVDAAVRNILTDPALRTVVPTAVFKTTNPRTTLAVVTGTPAASPVPPAVPVGAVAVMEVFVPAAAPDATTFRPTPRLWRMVANPSTKLNAVVEGCSLLWDTTADPSAAGCSISLGQGEKSAILIDGELIEFVSNQDVVFFTDTSANPYTGAAPATQNRTYFLYACGGRHLPQAAGSPLRMPIVVVESLTPPNLGSGQPSAAITTPRGVTITGACYIGMGFVYKGTTNRAPAIMSGDRVHAANDVIGEIGKDPTASPDYAFSCIPAFCLEADIWVRGISVAGNHVADVRPGAVGDVPALGLPMMIIFLHNPVEVNQSARSYFPSGRLANFNVIGTVVGDSVRIGITGLPHYAPRLDSNSGLRGV
jgi:hypothetical protein